MATRGWRTAIIVGASSGIGEALARRLAAEGCRVALVARRGEELARIQAELEAAHGTDCAISFTHDVRQYAEVEDVWRDIEGAFRSVDLVVYNAGALVPVGPSEYTFEKDRTMVEVNLLGCMAWLNMAALHMEAAGAGTIIGVSSIAGDRGRTGAPGYGASKAGMSTFLESLRNRLSKKGVAVATVRPGFVRTEMLRGVKKLFWVVSADRAAELILRAGRAGNVDRHVPARWGLVSLVLRSIPSFIFRRLSV